MGDQRSFADVEHEAKRKKTQRELFLDEMEQVVPWAELEALIEPLYPKAGKGRRPYPLRTMLRNHLMQQLCALSDPAMEESLYEIASMRKFARVSRAGQTIPDETTILNVRHLLEKHQLAPPILEAVSALLVRKGLMLKRGTIVDATIVDAPSSTKNSEGKRDPEMHQVKNGNQWYVGMKAHVGSDAESGLVHRVEATPANTADVTMAHALLHGEETDVLGDAGSRGVGKRAENRERIVTWHIAIMPGTRRALGDSAHHRLLDAIEKCKAQIRAEGEHAIRAVNRKSATPRLVTAA